MTPGPRPWDELEAALLTVAVAPPGSLGEQLQDGAEGLRRAVKAVLPDGDAELFLLVDQFEELFTLVDDPGRRARFMDTILDAVTAERARLRVVVTLRADFFDRPLSYTRFGELLRFNLEAVTPMSPDELADAIEGPADRVGVSVEPALTARIVSEVADQPGSLPLLQYALTELFDHRNGPTLTRDSYEQVGGVLGALGRRAEDLYERLDPARQEAARQLFLRLVTLGEGVQDTRRRVPRSELASIGGIDVDPVLDVFGRYRLLSFDRDPATRAPTVEVAHEALLREWTRFRSWIEAGRDDLRTQRRLAGAAAEWLAADRDEGYLLSGLRLAEFDTWEHHTGLSLTAEELSFLEASRAHEEEHARREQERADRELALEHRAATRRNILLVVMTVAAAVSAILTVLALRATGDANRQARLSRSRELAAEALAHLEDAPALSLLLAVEAVETTHSAGEEVTTEALDAVHRALAAQKTAFRLDGVDAAVSAGGTAVATIESEGIVVRGLDGTVIATLQPGRPPASIALSDDGTRVAAGGFDGWVEVLGLDGTREAAWEAHSERIGRIRFRDDRHVITSADDGLARLWLLPEATPVFSTAHSGDSVGIDAAGDLLVVGSRFRGAEIWDTRSGEIIRRIDETTGVDAVAISGDGRWIAVGTEAGDVTVSSVDESTAFPSFLAHAGRVLDVVFLDGDGIRVATAGSDGMIRVWDPETGDATTLAGHGAPVLHLTIGAGDVLVSVDGSGDVRAWDLGPASSRDGVAIRALPPVTSVAWSPDGSRVAVAAGSASDGTSASLWDPATGSRIEEVSHERGSVGKVAFGGNGELATSGPLEACVWDAAGRCRTLFAHFGASGLESESPGIAVDPSGSRAATAPGTGDLRLWDLGGDAEGRPLPGHTGFVTAVAFAEDGSLLASGDDGGTVVLWDAGAAVDLRRIPDAHPGGVTAVVFGDGVLATSGADGTAAVWDVEALIDGEPPAPLRLVGHAGPVRSVAVAPDGSFATGGDDTTVRLWKADGTEALVLRSQSRPVTSVAFDPTGTRLLAGSRDGVARIYVLDVDDLLAIARSRAPRGFTADECLVYLGSECPTEQ
jgi:WD40 repeat protein